MSAGVDVGLLDSIYGKCFSVVFILVIIFFKEFMSLRFWLNSGTMKIMCKTKLVNATHLVLYLGWLKLQENCFKSDRNCL